MLVLIRDFVNERILLNPKFWWKLVHIWHFPHSKELYASNAFPFKYLKEDVKSFEDLIYYIKGRMKWGIKGDIKQLFRWLWWVKIVPYWPLMCKGDRGGWQTRLCDYFENQARELDDMWDEIWYSVPEHNNF